MGTLLIFHLISLGHSTKHVNCTTSPGAVSTICGNIRIAAGGLFGDGETLGCNWEDFEPADGVDNEYIRLLLKYRVKKGIYM